ncbi:MAG: BON domain-containing protein [Nitrospira sp.]|nr:BON domain-containing protein [Nitrospira sp.]
MPQKPAHEAKPQPPAASKAKSETATEHKEGVPEKSAPRVPQAPVAADGQPATPKLSPDAKPQAPTIKADLPPDQEVKDKEPALKKTLGSLILSVKLALMGDSRLFHYEIEAEDDEQTITLSGRVSTEDEKASAKEVAEKVPGVKNVVNKLSVEKDLAKTLSKKQDDALTSLIKERFSKSATLKAANFEVKTEDGVVLIQGTVRFQVIALEAAEAARQVPGVRAVNTEKVRLEGES